MEKPHHLLEDEESFIWRREHAAMSVVMMIKKMTELIYESTTWILTINNELSSAFQCALGHPLNCTRPQTPTLRVPKGKLVADRLVLCTLLFCHLCSQ